MNRTAAFAALILLATGEGEAGPIVKPAAPGQPSRQIGAEESRQLGRTGFIPADARFYQDMIMHHAQAIEMVDLVRDRSTNRDLILIAKRIALSQASQMAIMRAWLEARGQAVESPHAHHSMVMNGMLSPAQMAALGAARGIEFDRQFLRGMIQHHRGAVQMVRDLNADPAAGKDPELGDFTASLVPDQSSEIIIMESLLRRIGSH